MAARTRTLFARAVTGSGLALAIGGVALDEVSLRILSRDVRQTLSEALLFVGISILCIGVVLLGAQDM